MQKKSDKKCKNGISSQCKQHYIPFAKKGKGIEMNTHYKLTNRCYMLSALHTTTINLVFHTSSGHVITSKYVQTQRNKAETPRILNRSHFSQTAAQSKYIQFKHFSAHLFKLFPEK